MARLLARASGVRYAWRPAARRAVGSEAPRRRSLARANPRRRTPYDFGERRCAPRTDLHLVSLLHIGHFPITASAASLRSDTCPLSPDWCPIRIGIGVRFHRNTHFATGPVVRQRSPVKHGRRPGNPKTAPTAKCRILFHAPVAFCHYGRMPLDLRPNAVLPPGRGRAVKIPQNVGGDRASIARCGVEQY